VEAIEARLQRFVNLTVPADSKLIEVRNNTSLDLAGHRLLLELGRLPGWPANPSVLSPK
jgi:ribose 1,5-bisphosphokinase PhnN